MNSKSNVITEKNNSLHTLMMAIRFIVNRIFTATLVLIIASSTSIEAVQAAQPSTQNRVISFFGSNYNANAVATKKNFSLASRKLKKDDKKLKIITNFSNAPVTYDFAITKLCYIAQWKVSIRSYTKCRAYAVSQRLLDAPLLENPNSPRTTTLTYENLAILIARTIDNKKGIRDTSWLQTTPAPLLSSVPPARNLPLHSQFISEDSATYDASFFSTVQLDEPLPKRFFLGELYFINGRILSSPTEDIFAFTCETQSGCANTTNYVSASTNNRFSIPIYFDKPGNFNLGIIPGRSGESRLATITVLAEEPALAANTAAQATNLSFTYEKGATTFSWNSNGFNSNSTSFSRVVFFQSQRRIDFLFRQALNSFTPESRFFKDFSTGPARWFIEQNGALSSFGTLNLVTQHFYKTEKSILISSFDDYYPSESPITLRFTGRANQELSNKVAITLPNGTVKDIVVSPENYVNGSTLSFSIPLSEKGTYIFEINDTTGAAALNAPVYVGNLTPLLPDFFALHEQKLNTSPLNDLNAARSTMLSLINNDRRVQGLSPVTLDSSLSAVAQSHSQNMLTFNFFSHTDQNNRTPDERRRANNFPTPIRENLGKSNSLEHVEAGLMRSPIHRDGILDPRMKKVGLGIVKNSEGYFLVTQNFSGDALSVQNVIDLKNQLLEHVSSFRKLKSYQSLNENSQASRAAVEWASTMSSQNFFSLNCPSSAKACEHSSVTAAVRAQNINGAFEVFTVRTSDETVLLDELLSESALDDPKYANIGLGFGVGTFGDVYLVVIYL